MRNWMHNVNVLKYANGLILFRKFNILLQTLT